MFDPFEYLVLRDKDGLLKKDFKTPLGKVTLSHPLPLARAEHRARRRARCSSGFPDTTVNTVERCSGHDGTWGVKTEFYAASMKIGRPVFRQMAQSEPDYVSSDCPIAGARASLQGIDEADGARRAADRASADPGADGLWPLDLNQHAMTASAESRPPRITRESLLTLEAYAKARKDFRARVLAHKKARTRAPRRAPDAAVRGRAHRSLPDPGDAAHREDVRGSRHPGRARRLQPAGPRRRELEGDDADRVRGRRRAQAGAGASSRASRTASGSRSRATPRVYAIADEDLERENDEKTSSVHFLRFELAPEMIAALKGGAALAMGVDHPRTRTRCARCPRRRARPCWPILPREGGVRAR